MKKIITLLLLAVTMSAFAEDHLKFMGITIDGSLPEFGTALEKKGFEKSSIFHQSVYEGYFAGREAYVIPTGDPASLSIAGVAVYFKNNGTWKDMESTYQSIKDGLQIKYGDPIEVKEVGAAPEYDVFISSRLKDETLVRRSIFINQLGMITVAIIKSDELYGVYPSVVYFDLINLGKAMQKAQDDL